MKDNEEILRTSTHRYELPQPGPDLRLKVMARVERDQRKRRLIHWMGQLGASIGFVTVIVMLAAWKPLQRIVEIVCRWMIALMPTDLAGLIWYSAIWISVGLALFVLTFLVMSGLRFLEE